jgi:hypothetical protein
MIEVRKSGFLRAIPLLITIFSLSFPTYAQYGGGTGEPNDPYLIYTAEHLNAIGTNQGHWDKHFKLMADIDLSSYIGTDFNIIGAWDNAFTGVFDGNGHTISNFTYTCTGEDEIGLFGCIGSAWGTVEIKDLGLINPNVDARRGVFGGIGSLAGYFDRGTITGCYVEGGSISGKKKVGGLVGENDIGTITNCYSSGDVSGSSDVGGLVGENSPGGTIAGCYASGSISGSWCGGLVGSNWGTIADCYATGSVSGESYVAGLIGAQQGDNSTTINCYSTGSVLDTWWDLSNGGLLAFFCGEVSNSFWDIEPSGQETSLGGTGKTTAEMQMESTFIDAGWDFMDETANGTEDIWWIIEGQDYPRLWWEPEVDVVEQVSFPLRGESGEIILGLGTLEAAAYSPDGKYIATAGSLGAFLWDAETGALLSTFRGHTDWHLPRPYGLDQFRGVFAGRDADPDGKLGFHRQIVECGDRAGDPHLPRPSEWRHFRGVFAGRDVGPDGV